SSRRRHTRFSRDWSSDVCSSDLPAAYSASMQQYLVADGHIIADDQGVAVGVEGPGVGNVQHAAILHAGTGTDADTVHVPADHRHGPDRTVLAQLDIPQDYRAGIHKHPLTQLRLVTGETAYIHLLPLELADCRHHLSDIAARHATGCQ